MLRAVLTAILLSFFVSTYSQKISVTYYDSSWVLTTKKAGVYYRVAIIDTVKYQFHGEVKDYYKNGKPQMKGRFQANIKTDTFYFYYPSGRLMKKGPYVNNVKYGVWTSYYENGKIKDKVFFNQNFIAALEYFDENGTPRMVNGTGVWETEYYDDEIRQFIKITASYKDTLRHGTWNYYHKPMIKGLDRIMELECVEEYQDDKFIKGKYYWEAGAIQELNSSTMKVLPETIKFHNTELWAKAHNLSIESYPYLKFLPKLDSVAMQNAGEWYRPDKGPEFPGGIEKFHTYLKNELKCQPANQKIFVEFLIDATGRISRNSVKLIRGNLSRVCTERLMSVLENCPRWTPAHVTKLGKDVPTKMVLPVNI